VGLLKRVTSLSASGVRPGLAVIRVGDHPPRALRKEQDQGLREVTIYSQDIQLPAAADESTLLGQIRALNNDPRIHGILVQLPLPRSSRGSVCSRPSVL